MAEKAVNWFLLVVLQRSNSQKPERVSIFNKKFNVFDLLYITALPHFKKEEALKVNETV